MQIKKDIYNCAVKQNTERMQIICFSDSFQTNLEQIPAEFINMYSKFLGFDDHVIRIPNPQKKLYLSSVCDYFKQRREKLCLAFATKNLQSEKNYL